MASGSQGKPAPASNGGGIFANGLPSIAALARSAGRLTASHFVSSSSSQKKAQRQQAANGAPLKSNNNSNNNHISSQQQHQAAYWAAEQAHQMNQQARAQLDPLAGRLRSASQNQCEIEQQQRAYAAHPHQLQEGDDDDAFYADQLRRGQLHQRLQLQQQQHQHQHQHQREKHHQPTNPPQASQQHRRHSATEPTSQRAAKPQQHVNFGQRSGQSSGRPSEEPDEDLDGESSRKKKYLTAKYGAQQMNLIKKRLKVEMWLHERLQELTSKSRALEPDELDELDIDLDQLLDLDDESTRKQHLKKLLAPLGDLPTELVDAFICDVLEQSKLL